MSYFLSENRQRRLYFVHVLCQNSVNASLWLSRDSAAHQEIAMSIKRPIAPTSQKAAIGLKSPPFGSGELAVFRRVIEEIAPDWTVELDGICTDEASLMVVPDGGDDQTGPSFAVTRETYGFRVDRVRWDVMTEVGVFTSLQDVLVAVRGQLAFFSGLEDLSKVTIH
jgi:hypothetical protein